MKNTIWTKIEKMINAGIQPEEHITYHYRSDRKKPVWTATIRFSKLKKYNSKGWSKKISSSSYPSLDAFYAASLAIRESMQQTLINAEASLADGKTPFVPTLPSSGFVSSGHTLDEIMGCKEGLNVDPNSGTPYRTRLKDDDGNYLTDSFGDYMTAPVMHMVVIPDNDFDSVYKGMLKFTTLQAQRYKYFNYIHPDYGNRTVESIQVGDVEQSLRKAGTSLGMHSIAMLKSVWKKIFTVARRKGYRPDDPTDLVITNNYRIVDHDAEKKRKKGSKKERREVSDEQFHNILEIVLADQNEISHNHKSAPSVLFKHQTIAHALILMRYTGIRPAECFGLRKQDLLIEKNNKGEIISACLKIEHAEARGEHNVLYVHETKTPLSNNIVPLNKDALETVQDMIKRGETRIKSEKTREIWNEHHTERFNNADFIFTDYYMNLCNLSRVSVDISRWLKPYGIEFNMYTERHQFSTDMSDQSVSVAQSLMRHASSSMTMKYIEGNEEKMQKAVDAISGDYSNLVKIKKN